MKSRGLSSKCRMNFELNILFWPACFKHTQLPHFRFNLYTIWNIGFLTSRTSKKYIACRKWILESAPHFALKSKYMLLPNFEFQLYENSMNLHSLVVYYVWLCIFCLALVNFILSYLFIVIICCLVIFIRCVYFCLSRYILHSFFIHSFYFLFK